MINLKNSVKNSKNQVKDNNDQSNNLLDINSFQLEFIFFTKFQLIIKNNAYHQ